MVRGAWYAAGFFAAAVPCALMWGFSVDDALIPLRYAHHLATGVGYRFDAHGPVTDGVTPLPWAPVLVPLASGDLLGALVRAKLLGAAAWTLAATMLGGALGSRVAAGASRLHAALALAVVALAFPIGAWAASGMETGLATALATFAAISASSSLARAGARPMRAAVLAGLAASLRPELVVWACALAFGAAGPFPARVGKAVAIAAAPFAATVLIRLAVFGHPAPLALSAKPSDLAHGLPYALAATIVVLMPLLALGAFAKGTSRGGRAIAAAAALHVAVVVAVGGDWMPYARLLVPIAPGLALVHLEPGRAVFATLRAAVALALGVALAVTGAPAGRHVLRDRALLVEQSRPLFAQSQSRSRSRVVAALDVGWVGAATDADIVDLAGLTDPAIAALPGGHTSKRVDVGMLLDRDVDTVVLFDPPRVVESRLSRAPLFGERFALDAEVPLGTTGRYRIYRRVDRER
jgi:hypothetical protein